MTSFQKKRAHFRSRMYLNVLKLMGLFGMGFLAACVKYGTPIAEYGVPVDDQKINFYGTVKSLDSLQNLPGIKVQLIDTANHDTVSTITASNGAYHLYQWAWEGQTFILKFQDVDSMANFGYFATKSVDIEISSRDANNFEKKVDVALDTL